MEDDFIDDFRQVHVPMVEKAQRSVEVPQVQHGQLREFCLAKTMVDFILYISGGCRGKYIIHREVKFLIILLYYIFLN